MSIAGLKDEVFEADGRVAFAIPPEGIKGAVTFEIKALYPSTKEFPAWADIVVGRCFRYNIFPQPIHVGETHSFNERSI